MAISPDQCVYVRGLSNPPKIQDWNQFSFK
jgi:hypothetical protein